MLLMAGADDVVVMPLAVSEEDLALAAGLRDCVAGVKEEGAGWC